MSDKSTVINVSDSKCVIKKTITTKLIENGSTQITTTVEEISGTHFDVNQLFDKLKQLAVDGFNIQLDFGGNDEKCKKVSFKGLKKEPKSDIKSEPKTGPKPEVKPESKPEPESRSKPESKSETKSEIKPEVKFDVEKVKTDSIVDKFDADCLAKHNQLRSLHGVQPLTINPKLNELAQDWANHLASTGSLSHRPKTELGENVFWSSLTSIKGDLPVDSWYSEIAKYNWDKATFISGTGHFTQVVWKGSKDIGIGKAVGKKGTFVVCNYEPAGNMLGKFGENVLPLAK